MKHIIFFVSGGLLGFLAWGNHIAFTLLSPLLFLAYFQIPKRAYIYLFALGYYLASSRGLLFGTATYYNDFKTGLMLWSSVAFVVSLPWIIFWSNEKKKRYILFLFALAASILPPFGFVSWNNPLPSAGLIFPGTGFFGFMFLLLLIYIASYIIDKKKEIESFKLIYAYILLLSITAFGSILYSPKGEEINAVQTAFQYDPDKPDRLKDYMRITKYLEIVQLSKENEILLPENALGFYQESQRVAWETMPDKKTVFAGGYIYHTGTNQYDNALLQIDKNTTKILYRQRVPVPVSMWRPFTEQGAAATIYKDPVIEIGDKSVGVLICYEQLITYVVMQTMFYHPDRIYGISNLYWSAGTSIEQIQRETLDLYGLLFGVDVYFSVNQ